MDFSESSYSKNCSLNKEKNDSDESSFKTIDKKEPNVENSFSYFGKCKICKDLATGIHYGVASCEGCKVNIIIISLINQLFLLQTYIKLSRIFFGFKKGIF